MSDSRPTLDQVFKLRLSARDRRRLAAIAAHYELSAAQAVRQLLRETAESIGTCLEGSDDE